MEMVKGVNFKTIKWMFIVFFLKKMKFDLISNVKYQVLYANDETENRYHKFVFFLPSCLALNMLIRLWDIKLEKLT